MKKASAGFTLIEIMLALLIFAILAVITSTVLYTVFNARNTTKEEMDHLAQLQVTMSLLQRDFSQISHRASVLGSQHAITFTRRGFINPLARSKRSHLQRVRYVFNRNTLIREFWPRVSPLPAEKVTRRVLLKNISKLQFQFLTKPNSFVATWPRRLPRGWQLPGQMPRGIQLQLTLSDWGSMQMLFRVPAGGP